ncbi:MAG: RnfABCDGE type electron transport complex subunit B [Clostridia bacterium]|nr:RnfABCDGE type electron transport complex subunit B [Clostridia bacterium]
MMDLLVPASVIGGLGIIFGLGLAFASKKFEVRVDERTARIREVLPGANCGGCGQTGCDAFAEGVAAGKCTVNGCPVGGADVAEKVAAIMGMAVGNISKSVARVSCNGSINNCKSKFNYSGIEDCTAAASLYGGAPGCSYGCIGLGSCARICDYGAIVVEEGVARVIQSKCTSCGKCVKACPKKLISLISAESEYTVRCRSFDKGNEVRKSCSVGCIGCGKCSKVCAQGAIKLEGNLAEIMYDRCKNCGECIKVCPTGSINRYFT